MPPPCDKTLKLAAQSLYLQGFAHAQIGERLGLNPGTVKTWANRHGWNKAVNKAKDQTETHLGKHMSGILERASKQARNRAATAITEALDKLPSPRSWNHAARLQSQLEPVLRNGKIVFPDWTDNQTQPSVRINLLAQAAVVSVSDKVQDQDKHALLTEPKTET